MNTSNILFKVEEEIESLSFEENKNNLQETLKQILDAFWSWIEKTAVMHTTNENLTKVLTYTVNHKKDPETILEDGRIPLSNNLCEENIKPFATARVWLFADTPKGARANVVLYTLIESADLQHPELLNQYLPWSKELRAYIKA